MNGTDFELKRIKVDTIHIHKWRFFMFAGRNKCLKNLLVAGVIGVLAGSCGRMSTAIESEDSGMVAIETNITSGLAKVSKGLMVEFDSLVIEISADDMATIRSVKPIAVRSTETIDTLNGVPAGKDRKVVVYTINKKGQTVHVDSEGEHLIAIAPNTLTELPVKLEAVLSSIYIQLSGVPTSVDSVVAQFHTDNNAVFSSKMARSSKININLDGIPDKTKGVLVVAGISAEGDTLYKAEKVIEVNAKEVVATQLSFQSASGGLSLKSEIQSPGVAVFSVSMGEVPVASVENGKIFITEIMYAANDSEYIEFYNPAKEAVVFDTLFVDIDGVKRALYNIRIEAESYFVVGRVNLPWSDVAFSVKSALDLSSAGNWLTLIEGDGTIIDQVAFTGGTNQIEWPKVTGKQSVCLSKDAYSAQSNNFGRAWIPAATLIKNSASQQGTPKE